MGLSDEDLKQLIQTGIFLVWKKEVSEEERQEIMSKFYLDNENQIEHLNTFEMKRGVNISDEFFRFRNRCQ